MAWPAVAFDVVPTTVTVVSPTDTPVTTHWASTVAMLGSTLVSVYAESCPSTVDAETVTVAPTTTACGPAVTIEGGLTVSSLAQLPPRTTTASTQPTARGEVARARGDIDRRLRVMGE